MLHDDTTTRRTGGAPPPSTAVGRARLVDVLDRFANSGLGLLCVWAPTGSGKTVLLDQWRAWLEGRGDAVLTVGRDAAPVTDRSTDGDRTWFFVDDAHRTLDAVTVVRLVELVRAHDGAVHVVVAGRYEPPTVRALQAAVDGRRDLHLDELAFTRAETAVLVQQSGFDLPPDDVASLHARTQGWAAALSLALASLRSDTSTSLDDWLRNDDSQQVVDVLVQRLLRSLAAPVADALVRSAVDAHVPLGLVDRLCGPGAIGPVGELAKGELLVTADEGGLTFHPLFLAYLQAEARRRDAVAAEEAHRIASRWYAEHDDPERALEHAARVEDQTALVALVEEHAPDLVLRGRAGAVRRALASLDPGVQSLGVAAVRLALELPWSSGPVGAATRLATAKRLLERAPAPVARRWTPFVVVSELFMTHAPSAMADVRRLLDSGTASPVDAASGAVLQLANAWWLLRTGSPDEALPVLRDLQLVSVQSGYHWLYLISCHMAADASAAIGDWRSAVLFDDRVSRAPVAVGPPFDRGTARAAVVATIRAYERGEDVALGPIRRVIADTPLGGDVDVELRARIFLLATEIDAAGERARSATVSLLDLIRLDGGSCPRAVAATALRLHHAALKYMGPAAAVEVRRCVARILEPTSATALSLRLAAAPAGDVAAEQALLAALERGHAWHGAGVTNAWLALAEHADAGGREAETVKRVTQALEIAGQYGFLQPFLARDGAGARLLHRFRGRFGLHDGVADRVLQLARRQGVDLTSGCPLGIGLTRKERELLADLPMHQTVAEIARSHHLSVNTVKTHLRSVYAKLGASDRTQAVVAARERGLL